MLCPRLFAAICCAFGFAASCGPASAPEKHGETAAPAPPDTCLCLAGASETIARAKDDTTFLRRCEQLAGWYPANVRVVNSGRQLLRIWEDAARRTGAAPLTLIFAHGDEYGLFFRPEEGFYRDTVLRSSRLNRKYGGGERMASVSELRQAAEAGRIVFAPEKPVALLSCNSRALGEDLNALGAAVLCSEGFAGPLNRADSAGETGYMFAEGGFWYLPPGAGKPDSLGKMLAPALWLERRSAPGRRSSERAAQRSRD